MSGDEYTGLKDVCDVEGDGTLIERGIRGVEKAWGVVVPCGRIGEESVVVMLSFDFSGLCQWIACVCVCSWKSEQRACVMALLIEIWGYGAL